MIRVLLVDDHPVVRTGYRRLLEQTGDIEVFEAGDGQEGYAVYQAHLPDVLVTDLSMARWSGFELLQRVRARHGDLRALIFTMHDSLLLARRALDEGASGFVTKASPPEHLLRAIRIIHGGGRYVSPEVARALAIARPATEAELLNSLSAREFEIFRLLATGRTAAQCAADLHLSPKTVANQQSAIKDKLGVSTTAALAHLAIRHKVITIPEL